MQQFKVDLSQAMKDRLLRLMDEREFLSVLREYVNVQESLYGLKPTKEALMEVLSKNYGLRQMGVFPENSVRAVLQPSDPGMKALAIIRDLEREVTTRQNGSLHFENTLIFSDAGASDSESPQAEVVKYSSLALSKN